MSDLGAATLEHVRKPSIIRTGRRHRSRGRFGDELMFFTRCRMFEQRKFGRAINCLVILHDGRCAHRLFNRVSRTCFSHSRRRPFSDWGGLLTDFRALHDFCRRLY